METHEPPSLGWTVAERRALVTLIANGLIAILALLCVLLAVVASPGWPPLFWTIMAFAFVSYGLVAVSIRKAMRAIGPAPRKASQES